MPHQRDSVNLNSARYALTLLSKYGFRLVGLLLIAFCASVLRRHHSDPPTRHEQCGVGIYQPSRIVPSQSQWHGSAEQRRFVDALSELEALIYCLRTDETLGCSGEQPTLCFRCAEVGLNEKCAYHDWGGGWSWTYDLRSCLVQTRPTEDFYLYVISAPHRGSQCQEGRRTHDEVA